MLTRTQESELNMKREGESLMSCQMWNRLASDGRTLRFFFFFFFSILAIQFSSAEPDIRTLHRILTLRQPHFSIISKKKKKPQQISQSQMCISSQSMHVNA